MPGKHSNRSRAFWARGFAALSGLLALAGACARPAEAAPFAYVTNSGATTVSVIDAATNGGSYCTGAK